MLNTILIVLLSLGSILGQLSRNQYISLRGAHDYNCTIQRIVQGEWYSRESNEDRITIIDANQMTGRGVCKEYHNDFGAEYKYLFSEDPTNEESCHYCVYIYVRTPNILEKKESGCIQLGGNLGKPDLATVCSRIPEDQQIVTMFAENYTPINCRSSIEGVYRFSYQFRFTFTTECIHPEQQIHSCQDVGSQFLISNQKFNVTFKKCPNMAQSRDQTVEYSCLGDWFVGKDHFFAVANTKESRKDEKFRCFLKNRDDDRILGVSITPECNQIKTVEQAPQRMKLVPVERKTVEPGCFFPENFTGSWVNTANIDADVFINSTHIIETWHPDVGRTRQNIYVCKEQKDSRYMMARLTIEGCQVDYQCFEYLPRHHNVIRFRKGLVMILDDFHTVCSWIKFPNKEAWKYDVMIMKDPIPVRCPVAGAFTFEQTGDFKFRTRVIKGITKDPRDTIWNKGGQWSCRKNISRMAVCDTDQKEMTIDETYCWSLDHKGRPVDIYSDVDYRMQCVGYWKENLKSYLITYDQLDAFTKYRCWVYQRADLNKMLMSMSVGPFCDMAQDVTSTNWTEGAAVSLKLDENEREFDRCPVHFDDGSDPWTVTENHIRVFDFDNLRTSSANNIYSINILNIVFLIMLLIATSCN